METAPEIIFHDVKRSETLVDLINEKIKKLEQFSDKIISCRVTLGKPQSHQRSGRPYEINITVRVPGRKDVVVTRSTAKGSLHEDLKTLLNESFDAVSRQLKKIEEKKRGDVKTPADEAYLAQISKLYPEEGYGYLQPRNEGPEIYFDQNSLLTEKFEDLTVGTYVTYEEEISDRGARAYRVRIT